MIVALFLAHYGAFIAGWVGESHSVPLPLLLLAGLSTLAFFFKLRLYDELKDHEEDAQVYPDRPLVCGVLQPKHLKIGIAVCFAVELAGMGVLGAGALAGMGMTIAYSMLMYREFFLSGFLRPRLTAYAVVHTVVTVLLTHTLFAAFTGQAPWKLDGRAWRFALGSWCLFNLFEFGRKTFAAEEERDEVNSYSKVWTRWGAVALAWIMAGAATWLMLGEHLAHSRLLLGWAAAIGTLLLAAGLAYGLLNRPPFGQVYRGATSGFLVLLYLGIAVACAYARQSR
jgi:4-hydroxybenzoate polyprenyltransferase